MVQTDIVVRRIQYKRGDRGILYGTIILPFGPETSRPDARTTDMKMSDLNERRDVEDLEQRCESNSTSNQKERRRTLGK